jgi:hypothetical protein
MRTWISSGTVAVLVLAPGLVMAQAPTLTCDSPWDDGEDRYCEIRELTLPAGRSPIAIDAGANGGVRVHGWDRNEIRLVMRVQSHASSESRAREIAQGVRVATDRTIHATGPDRERREWWSVSYEAFVPTRSDLDLETLNGGIHIVDVQGRIRFSVTNGGVSLAGLGGDVSGRSTNGGVHVDLRGMTWDGPGLDVQTTTGGATISVPTGYSAHLETGTTNGSLRFDFPITVQGQLNRRLSVDLGDGGPTIRVVTTNGGVTIKRPEI